MGLINGFSFAVEFPDREEVARHEAAHALMSIQLGWNTVGIGLAAKPYADGTYGRDIWDAGLDVFSGAEDEYHRSSVIQRGDDIDQHEDLLVLLAGPMASLRYISDIGVVRGGPPFSESNAELRHLLHRRMFWSFRGCRISFQELRGIPRYYEECEFEDSDDYGRVLEDLIYLHYHTFGRIPMPETVIRQFRICETVVASWIEANWSVIEDVAAMALAAPENRRYRNYVPRAKLLPFNRHLRMTEPMIIFLGLLDNCPL